MSICPLSLPRLSSCRFPAARTTRRTRRSRGTIRRAAIASPNSRARKAPTRCWPSSSSPATGRARPRWAYGVLGDLADTGVERRERASPLAQLQEGQTGWAGEAGGDGARRGDHRPSHGDGCQSRGGGFPAAFPVEAIWFQLVTAHCFAPGGRGQLAETDSDGTRLAAPLLGNRGMDRGAESVLS